MNDDILRIISDLQRRIEALETGEVVGLDWDKTWTDAVHSHASAGEGGQLDWDVVWSDAVHDHSSNAEGGILPQDAVKVSKLVASDGAPDPALSADASGYLTAAVEPLVSAYLANTVSNVTGDGTNYQIIFDTELIDRGSNFNLATSTFLAPVTKQYLVVFSALAKDLGVAHTYGDGRIVTSNGTHIPFYMNPYAASSGGYYSFSGSRIVDMDAGDTSTINILVNGGTKIIDVVGGATIYTCVMIFALA